MPKHTQESLLHLRRIGAVAKICYAENVTPESVLDDAMREIKGSILLPEVRDFTIEMVNRILDNTITGDELGIEIIEFTELFNERLQRQAVLN